MTMTNAEWMIQNGYKFEDIRLTPLNDRVAVIDVNGKKDPLIIQTQGVLYSFMKWLDSEHKEPILDDAERRYLAGVIRPFRDDVQYIVKFGGKLSSRAYEEIAVRYQDKMSGDKYYFLLPKFDKDTMYKGMEVNRHYTLEELGL